MARSYCVRVPSAGSRNRHVLPYLVLDEVFFAGVFDAATALILRDPGLEEILLFPKKYHFIKPTKRIHFHRRESRKLERGQAAIGIEIDIVQQIRLAQANHVFGKAVANEFFFQLHAFTHKGKQFSLKRWRPEIWVFCDQLGEYVATKRNVV